MFALTIWFRLKHQHTLHFLWSTLGNRFVCVRNTAFISSEHFCLPMAPPSSDGKCVSVFFLNRATFIKMNCRSLCHSAICHQCVEKHILSFIFSFCFLSFRSFYAFIKIPLLMFTLWMNRNGRIFSLTSTTHQIKSKWSTKWRTSLRNNFMSQ